MIEDHMDMQHDSAKRKSFHEEIKDLDVAPVSKRTYTDLSGLNANKKNFMEFRKEAIAKAAAKKSPFDKPVLDAPVFGQSSDSFKKQETKPLGTYRTRTDITGMNRRMVEDMRNAGKLRQAVLPSNYIDEDKKINMVQEIVGMGANASVADYMSDILEVMSADGKDLNKSKKSTNNIAEVLHKKALKAYEDKKREHDLL